MDTTTLRLSQEELLFVLRSVGERSIPGMGVARLPEVDEPTLDALTDAGARALIARSLLTFEQDRLKLDSSLFALVVACTHPEQMVSLAVMGAKLPVSQSYFYRVPRLHIHHTPDAFGTHNFELAADGDMGASTVATLLAEGPDEGSPSASYTLAQETLAVAEAQSRGGSGAEHALMQAGMPPAEAASLSNALREQRLNLIVQLIAQLQPVVEQVLFRVVVGEQHVWLVQGDTLEATQLTAQRLTMSQVRALLLERFTLMRSSEEAW